jgi:hypothetical protein
MKPATQDLYIYRGDFFEFFFRVRTRVFDLGTSKWIAGDYRDLTGWTGTAQVRATADASTILGSFLATVVDQTVTLGGVYVTMEAGDTASLPVGTAKWDCQLIDVAGKPRTYLAGDVVIAGDVTR